MTVDTKFKKCLTCKYFLQHYIKKYSSFHEICCGHCVNRQLNGSRVRNKYELHANCEFWESNEEKKAERRENIKEVLANMQEHLSEIVSILKDDWE